MVKNKFSSRLKGIREQAGLSQKELAAKLGITYTKYNHYETGRNQPDIDTILQISDFFNIPTDFLLGRETEQNENVLPSETSRLLAELSNADDETAKELQSYLNYLKSKKEQAATGTET